MDAARIPAVFFFNCKVRDKVSMRAAVFLLAVQHSFLFKNSLICMLQALPDAAITGDVIVGFPGETEEQFQHTLDLMERVKFDNLNTFRCEPRISSSVRNIALSWSVKNVVGGQDDSSSARGCVSCLVFSFARMGFRCLFFGIFF